MYYFKLQCLDEDVKKGTNALQGLAKLFDIKLHQPETPWMESFYFQLPEDPKTACHIINAIYAFVHFYNFSQRLENEKISVPFETFVKNLDKMSFS